MDISSVLGFFFKFDFVAFARKLGVGRVNGNKQHNIIFFFKCETEGELILKLNLYQISDKFVSKTIVSALPGL